MTKKHDFSTGVSSDETELLALLIEECGEVIQAATKVLRHGWESFDPTRRGERPTNREALAKELGHLDFAVHLMQQSEHVSARDIAQASSDKASTINRWLHFNKAQP